MKILLGQKVEITVYTKTGHIKDKTELDKHTDKIVGTFLEFGIDSEDGKGFSTAIVKLPDGTIKNVYVELVKFIK